MNARFLFLGPALLLALFACSSKGDDLFGRDGGAGGGGTGSANGATIDATVGETTSGEVSSNDGAASTASTGLACDPGLGDCEGNGCTTNVYTHAEHCGACGHSCLGGACVNGACAPVLLAEPEYGRGIGLDGDHVYYVDYLAGEVRRVAKVGGPSQLLGHAIAPMNVAIDATHVYWTDAGDFGAEGQVARAPKEGGSTEVLAETSDAVGIAVDASNVFYTLWTSPGSVRSVPKGGGAVSVLAANEENPRAIRVADGVVYWSSQGSIGQADGVVRSKAAAGGPAAPKSLAVGQFVPEGIDVHDGEIYWTTYYGNTVMRAPVGGGPATMIASGMTGPRAVAVDASGIYWVEEGYTTTANGGVWRADHGGGAPVALRANEPQPQDVAVDDVAVFWSSASGIWKLAK